MECQDFKMMLKEMRTNPNTPEMIQPLAEQVYQEWMDCEGSDFSDEFQNKLASEPMDIAFDLLKSEKLISNLFKIDWDDDPEDATEEERFMDRLANRAGDFQEWEGPKREFKPELEAGERRPRGQVGTRGGKVGTPPGLSSKDAKRIAEKKARLAFQEAKRKLEENRQRKNRRDEKIEEGGTHPGSILFNVDELNPAEAKLPGRLSRVRGTDKEKRQFDHVGRHTIASDVDWNEWKKNNPEVWEQIESGDLTMQDFMRILDEDFFPYNRQPELQFAHQVLGIDAVDPGSGGLVDSAKDMPSSSTMDELGARGHLDDMEHEFRAVKDDDGEMKIEQRGQLQGTPERAEELQELHDKLKDAPKVNRRVMVQPIEEHPENDLDELSDEERWQQAVGEMTDPDPWQYHGQNLVYRPTFFGMPWNEESGFTMGEPMDIAWDSILKSRKV